MKDYSGMTIKGTLIVCSTNTKDKHGKILWKCVCKCGKEIFKTTGDISRKDRNTLSCGCSRGLENGEARINELIGDYKYSADKRNLSFNLTDNEIKFLIKDKCFYCERFPYREYKSSRSLKYKGNLICNGIDRIDNNKGYSIDNVVTACKECNILRSNTFTPQETKVMVTALNNFRNSI